MATMITITIRNSARKYQERKTKKRLTDREWWEKYGPKLLIADRKCIVHFWFVVVRTVCRLCMHPTGGVYWLCIGCCRLTSEHTHALVINVLIEFSLHTRVPCRPAAGTCFIHYTLMLESLLLLTDSSLMTVVSPWGADTMPVKQSTRMFIWPL